MSPHARPMRGLSDLRTLTGRSDTQIPAHKAYLRVSFLELERARHEQEVRTMQLRLDHLAARCREIGVETSEILASVAGNGPRTRPVEAPRSSAVGRRPKRAGFQFSY